MTLHNSVTLLLYEGYLDLEDRELFQLLRLENVPWAPEEVMGIWGDASIIRAGWGGLM